MGAFTSPAFIMIILNWKSQIVTDGHASRVFYLCRPHVRKSVPFFPIISSNEREASQSANIVK